MILERRVGYRVLRCVRTATRATRAGPPCWGMRCSGDGLDDVLQNQVRGRRDGRFIGRCVAEPSVQKVRPVMLRRDRVDRVVDGPLNHPHVDLRCRWCSARRAWKPRPRNAGDRADRNEVPLRHCSGVCIGGWCSRCADDAERPYEPTHCHRDEPDESSTYHVAPSPLPALALLRVQQTTFRANCKRPRAIRPCDNTGHRRLQNALIRDPRDDAGQVEPSRSRPGLEASSGRVVSRHIRPGQPPSGCSTLDVTKQSQEGADRD